MSNTFDGLRQLYDCDPELNVACTKEHCYLNGGACTKTKNLMFARKPIEKITLTLMVAVDDEEAQLYFGAVGVEDEQGV